MTQGMWTRVDAYFSQLLLPPDAVLNAVQAASDAAGLPPIQVSPTQGKFLWMLGRLLNAGRILEIGTLGGYSTVWLARALAPGGRLITLEVDSRHADAARENMKRAGLADRVEVRNGSAHDLLPALAAEGAAPFDLVFIDADKASTAVYLDWSLRLTRAGGLIIIDNVVRQGKVIDRQIDDASVQGIRRAMDWLAAEPRLSATVLQTVDGKGYDGMVLAYVIDTSYDGRA
ncbi:MAG: O-methyltransferase [Anaerolineae bacterium]|nr:O-methyltransferase [Anaerolineae bacterium]NUQ02876.1 O-methyltransferase [Anaerolineae bacterium]